MCLATDASAVANKRCEQRHCICVSLSGRLIISEERIFIVYIVQRQKKDAIRLCREQSGSAAAENIAN